MIRVGTDAHAMLEKEPLVNYIFIHIFLFFSWFFHRNVEPFVTTHLSSALVTLGTCGANYRKHTCHSSHADGTSSFQ